MVENTRRHERIPQHQPPGRRIKLSVGSLFISPAAEHHPTVPLLIHFHGPDWLANTAAVQWKKRVCVVTIQLGAGSGVYSRAFAEPERFSELLKEAEKTAGLEFKPVVISSFSAGYGAVREILGNRANWPSIDAII